MTWSRVGHIDEQAASLVPTWFTPVVEAVRTSAVERLTRFVPPHGIGKHSAVLMLFGEAETGPDVLLIQRAAQMRSHAGQPAFPGGAVEAVDADAVQAALREAAEETGLEPAGVTVVGRLPDLWVPVTNYVVTPVLGWWREPTPVFAKDVQEVARVARVPVTDLVAPANRCMVRHPSGYVGPGFTVADMLVWGFTAGVLSTMLDAVGWAQPWDDRRVLDLPDVAGAPV
jgi:8-oxo-dGTP pyrophosphatase MutT (NUDIX family)